MKNTISKYLKLFILLSTITIAYSCKKQDEFLNVKLNNSDVTPTSLPDFQALLDNTNIMNASYPVFGLVSSDNYYVTQNTYNADNPPSTTAYIWAPDIWQSLIPPDWGQGNGGGPYVVVEYANVVLDGLKTITPMPATQAAYNNAEGSALFYRAFAFYNVAAEFCKPYIASSATTDLGLPLRLTSDVNVKSTRATVQQTYDQIISDLKTALTLLPATALHTTRPCVTTVNALLAKVYLSMGDYANAETYANAVLQSRGTLMDFNNSSLVQVGSSDPFPTNPDQNPEMLFYAESAGSDFVWGYSSGFVDSTLYSSYNNNDLRKTTFYLSQGNNQEIFVGTYDGYGTYDFSGIATNEIYLIRAECYARAGNTKPAMQDLNTLLVKRFVTGTFVPLTATSAANALAVILQERRKELAFNSISRWEDLRRLNQDPNFAVTLKRIINNTTYTLLPNDPRYVLPIPAQVIQLTGMQQNPR